MIRCIQISPHIVIQGQLVASQPLHNTATIKCNGKLWTGPLVQSFRRGEIIR